CTIVCDKTCSLLVKIFRQKRHRSHTYSSYDKNCIFIICTIGFPWTAERSEHIEIVSFGSSSKNIRSAPVILNDDLGIITFCIIDTERAPQQWIGETYFWEDINKLSWFCMTG